VDCFQVAPSLVDASVFNEDRFIPVSLPIHNLTRYHLNCPWRTHAGILALAKNLVEAYIAVSFDEEPWPPSSETIELGSLLRLFVSHAEVLDNLRTPHLEEIAVAFLPGEAPSLPTHLSSLIIRSLCPLRRLCLAGGPAPGPTAEILSKIPSIVDLGIIIPETQSDPVDAFILSLGGPGLGGRVVAPHLRSISFLCDDETDFDFELYLAMVKSRWEAEGCALKSSVLLMSSDRELESSAIHGLDGLRREGFDFALMKGIEASYLKDQWTFFPLWN
jgi:hypothetical protein